MHLRTRLVCSEIICPLKKFAIYFSKIFKDLCTENRGEMPRKTLRQQTLEIDISVFLIRARRAEKLKHRVAVFLKTVYLLRQQK